MHVGVIISCDGNKFVDDLTGNLRMNVETCGYFVLVDNRCLKNIVLLRVPIRLVFSLF